MPGGTIAKGGTICQIIRYLAHLIWMRTDQDISSSPSFRVRALRDTLKRTSLSSWMPLPGALMWCLLVGIDGSFGDSVLYPWFVSQLHRLWLPLGATRWQELQRSLSCFGWLLRCGRDSVSG
jgi:hypothetical protein